MKRPNPILVSLSASLLTSALLLTASAANAQPGAGFYAKPVTAPAASSLVVRDTLWKCADGACVANPKATSRPAFICQSLAKKVGELSAFRAGSEEFDAEALAKCNAKA